MSENPAVVVAGGSCPDPDWARPRLRAAGLVFCADSGLRLCQACGVVPHMLVGDLDSLSADEVAALPPLRFGIERHPCDKDFSDLHLTLVALARHYQGPVEILAALGGRLDHQLFNLCSVLFVALDLGLLPRVVEPETVVLPLRGRLQVNTLAGWTCSILPLSQRLEGVTLAGFRYPLCEEPLGRHETRGLSNLVESQNALIDIQGGEGLVILTRTTLD